MQSIAASERWTTALTRRRAGAASVLLGSVVAVALALSPAASVIQAQTAPSAGARATRGAALPTGLAAAMHRALGSKAPRGLATSVPLTATWSQQAELAAPTGVPGDQFGLAVAIGGNNLYGTTALVGVPEANGGAGAAYVFTRDAGATTWSEQAKLIAPASVAGDHFGQAVAVAIYTVGSGSPAVALIGAPGTNGGAGAAYVFTRGAGLTTWSAPQTLTATAELAGSSFGQAVALYKYALIGAPGANANTGVAYEFARPPHSATWVQQAELTAPAGTPGDRFGQAVGTNNSRAVIGAPGTNASTGAAYGYLCAPTCTPQGELTAPGGIPGDQFGQAVAVGPGTAVIGAPGANANTGTAYAFFEPTNTWMFQAQLLATDRTTGAGFGSSVSMNGAEAVIGAPFVQNKTGAAYAFVDYFLLQRTGWAQQAELTAADGAPGDYFGQAVAGGLTALIGAPLRDNATGAAYVFVSNHAP